MKLCFSKKAIKKIFNSTEQGRIFVRQTAVKRLIHSVSTGLESWLSCGEHVLLL